MTNPLMGATRPANDGVYADFRRMVPGEVRTVMLATREDGKGHPDPTSREAKTITRTNRPFIADWVDSANEDLAARRSPFRWTFKDGPDLPPELVSRRFIRGDQ